MVINPLNAELNPICHLLVLLAHPILHISRIRIKGNSGQCVCVCVCDTPVPKPPDTVDTAERSANRQWHSRFQKPTAQTCTKHLQRITELNRTVSVVVILTVQIS
jgi:hypothetical protein